MSVPETPMSGRVLVVTGASSGLGMETARAAARMGATVVMVNRDLERSEVVMEEIRSGTGSADVHLVLADFADLGSVRLAARSIVERFPAIDVLVNNAGIIAPEREVTADGHELTLQVNHLAPFLLTTLLRDAVIAAGPDARIVTVASHAHYAALALPLYDLDMTAGWSPFRAYAATKLENVLFARELARRLAGRGVSSNSANPGAVATRWGADLHSPSAAARNAMLRPLRKTAREGAESQIWLATAPEAATLDGAYVSECKAVEPSRLGSNDGLARRLWEVTEAMVGEKWPDPLPAVHPNADLASARA